MRSVRVYDSVAALPPDALTLLEGGGLFSLPAWWEVVEQHAIPAGGQPGYVVATAAGAVVGVLPVLRRGRHIDALTTPYTCAFTPAMTGDIAAVAAQLGRVCRTSGLCRLDALPAEWHGLTALQAGMRRVGLATLRFDHFGNWSEDVRGLDWAAYLAGRAGALRETIRRRLRRAEAMAEARLELVSTVAEIDRAAAAFEAVYARSWKEPEPYPTFNVALIRRLAPLGLVRIGIWSIAGTPVAAQIWVVHDGTATVLKLAHDEAFKAHSPGTVLTAMMVRHMLAREQVRRIDFGRGDDGYKRGWAAERRQRIGLLLAAPWSVAGLAALMRHAGGHVRRGLRGRAGSAFGAGESAGP